MKTHSTKWLLAIAPAVALAATACGGSRTAGRMSVAATAVAPATPSAGGALELGQGITVTRVRLAVASVKLEAGGDAGGEPAPSGGAGGGDDGISHAATEHGSSGDGDAEARVGPFTVDLSGDALAGGVRRVFDGDVPAGAYRELAIEIAPVDAGALSTMGGRSVIVDGTLDGAPFTFSSALRAVQKAEGAFTVAADGASSRVTLSVDPHGWFAGPDRRLDPTSEADRATIEANVAASIRVSRDDDGGDDAARDGADASGR